MAIIRTTSPARKSSTSTKPSTTLATPRESQDQAPDHPYASQGAAHRFIAKCLNLHGNSVTNHLKQYREDKLAAVLEGRYYRPSSSLARFMACLACSGGLVRCSRLSQVTMTAFRRPPIT